MGDLVDIQTGRCELGNPPLPTGQPHVSSVRLLGLQASEPQRLRGVPGQCLRTAPAGGGERRLQQPHPLLVGHGRQAERRTRRRRVR